MVLLRCLLLAPLCCAGSFAHGQAVPPKPARWQAAESYVYAGVEGIILANRFTQFSNTAPFLSAADKDLSPRPAFVLGYQLSPRWALEARAQDLAVLTGYSFERQSARDYLGFGQSYTQDYLYLPIHAIYKVLGAGHRVGLSLVAGGGPAWTDTSESPITPNGTTVFYSSGNGSTIGTGPTQPAGSTLSATVTQQIIRQQGFLLGFEAGVRGNWQVRPRLGLHLTVRQLWSSTRSVRDMSLTIQTATGTMATTMATPLRGIATGLGVHYAL